jgi:hypothetical protein
VSLSNVLVFIEKDILLPMFPWIDSTEGNALVVSVATLEEQVMGSDVESERHYEGEYPEGNLS